MERLQLKGLRPQAYEHPSDRTALDILTRTAGFSKLVSKLNEWSLDRLLRVQLTGSYLRASADCFPGVHRILQNACELLDLPLLPELYLAPGPLNAFTAGVSRPIILLSSTAIDLLTDCELLFVIAHEVGHIKSGHVLYYQIADVVPFLGEIVGLATLGIGELVGTSLQVALLHWKRMAEFTADRAGLLGCQDADVALGTMMKLAGLPAKYFSAVNTQDFIEQSRSFEAMNSDKLSLLAKGFSIMGASHPWTVMRAQQLLTWIDNGGYETVLKTPQRIPGQAAFCNQCGCQVTSSQAFCPGCGRSVAAFKTAAQQ